MNAVRLTDFWAVDEVGSALLGWSRTYQELATHYGTAILPAADLNARIMRRLGVSRIELLETIDRPALKALPSEPYQYAEWKKCRVAQDYHVEVDHHYYSVP
jgi:hypothetical protein